MVSLQKRCELGFLAILRPWPSGIPMMPQVLRETLNNTQIVTYSP